MTYIPLVIVAVGVVGYLVYQHRVENSRPLPEPEDVVPTHPGWYCHPTMAETQCYWDGAGWTDKIAPIGKSQGIGTWQGIRIVAVGVLAAIAILYLLSRT